MSRCDICERDVDTGVSCGECQTNADEEQALAAEWIAVWLERRVARREFGTITIGEYRRIEMLATEIRAGRWKSEARSPGDGYCDCGERLDKEHTHGVD